MRAIAQRHETFSTRPRSPQSALTDKTAEDLKYEVCRSLIELGDSHNRLGCPYNHEAIQHFFLCTCCKLEDGDLQLNGERHSENVCGKRHNCCSWLLSIVATELNVLRRLGIDPIEYTQGDPEIKRRFDHGFDGVKGPHWVTKWERPWWN